MHIFIIRHLALEYRIDFLFDFFSPLYFRFAKLNSIDRIVCLQFSKGFPILLFSLLHCFFSQLFRVRVRVHSVLFRHSNSKMSTMHMNQCEDIDMCSIIIRVLMNFYCCFIALSSCFTIFFFFFFVLRLLLLFLFIAPTYIDYREQREGKKPAKPQNY